MGTTTYNAQLHIVAPKGKTYLVSEVLTIVFRDNDATQPVWFRIEDNSLQGCNIMVVEDSINQPSGLHYRLTLLGHTGCPTDTTSFVCRIAPRQFIDMLHI